MGWTCEFCGYESKPRAGQSAYQVHLMRCPKNPNKGGKPMVSKVPPEIKTKGESHSEPCDNCGATCTFPQKHCPGCGGELEW